MDLEQKRRDVYPPKNSTNQVKLIRFRKEEEKLQETKMLKARFKFIRL